MTAGRVLLSAVMIVVALSAASQPWRGSDPEHWSKEDVEHVLNQSPWAQTAGVGFPDHREDPPASVYSLPGPAQAGMAGSQGATDGRWDGGVGKNTGIGLMPILSVLVRWDSALPIRQALQRSRDLANPAGHVEPRVEARVQPADRPTDQPADRPKSYVLTVIGLIPAKQYDKVGTLTPKSSSNNDEGATRPPIDTEHVLEGLMTTTRLGVRNKAALAPEDVKLDPDTGTIHIYFPRTFEIQKSDKEVWFYTRFGALSLIKRFRLNEMAYQGRLEL